MISPCVLNFPTEISGSCTSINFLQVRAAGARTGVSGVNAGMSNRSAATDFIILLLAVPTGEPDFVGS